MFYSDSGETKAASRQRPMGNSDSRPDRSQAPPSKAQLLIDAIEVPWNPSSMAAGSRPSPRETAGCATADGTAAVVVGGRGLEDETIDVWSTRPGSDWQKHSPAGRAPRPRAGHTVVSTSAGVVIFGGISHAENGGYLADVAVLTPDLTAWEPVCVTGELPCARDKHAAVVLSSGHMLVMGGFGVRPPDDEEGEEDEGEENEGEGEGEGEGEESGDGERRGPSVDMTWFNDTYKLEVRTWRWSKLLPSATGTAAAAPVAPAAPADSADASEPAPAFPFAIAGKKKMAAAPAIAVLPPARAALAACLLPRAPADEARDGERLVIFGGRTATGRVDDTWVLEPLGGSGTINAAWREPHVAGARPAARSFHTSVAVGEGLMALFGGLGVDDRHLNDLHLLHASREGEWMWAAVRQAGALPSPRGCMVLACLGGAGSDALAGSPHLLVFGGSSGWSEHGVTHFHDDMHTLPLAGVLAALKGTMPDEAPAKAEGGDQYGAQEGAQYGAPPKAAHVDDGTARATRAAPEDVAAEGPEPKRQKLAVDALDSLEPAARMQALGNSLYPAICQLLGEPLAGKVTGMLIEMPTQSVLDCLAAPETLKTTVEQALKVLSTDVCTMAAGEAAAATAEAAVA